MNQHHPLLKQLNLPPLPFLGSGMQCQVFADGNSRVLKIYPAAIGTANLERLQAFYASLNTTRVDFETPSILQIEPRADFLLVSEKRLGGSNANQAFLCQRTPSELETYFRHYVQVLFSLQHLTTPLLQPAEPLDQSGDFYAYACYESWSALLRTNLQRKLASSGSRYAPFIPGLNTMRSALDRWIAELPPGEPCLIHGDFFPGNTLVNQDLHISAVLDFGTFTVIGDPIYDIALGWAFADMYHEVNHFPVKEFVGELISRRVTAEEQQRMKVYLLIYSLLSADLYGGADVNDGHFRWAMNNLNEKNIQEALP